MFSKIINLYQAVFTSPDKYARRIDVTKGKNCDIQTRFFGSELYLIEIGDHVLVTSGVKFFNHGGAW